MGKQGVCGGKWSYPYVPVYVVCPRDGKGCSRTLHRNYLLPISPTLEQARDHTLVAGVEQTRMSAPAPPVDSEPTNSEPSRMATSDMTSNTSQGSQACSLHLDMAHMQHGTKFHGSTAILHCQQISAHLASWICGLVCAFASP